MDLEFGLCVGSSDEVGCVYEIFVICILFGYVINILQCLFIGRVSF